MPRTEDGQCKPTEWRTPDGRIILVCGRASNRRCLTLRDVCPKEAISLGQGEDEMEKGRRMVSQKVLASEEN